MFYARYVPPSKSNESPKALDQPTAPNSTKRKYKSSGEPHHRSEKRQKRSTRDLKSASLREVSEENNASLQGASDQALTEAAKSKGTSPKKTSKPNEDGAEIIAKYSIGESARNRKPRVNVTKDTIDRDDAALRPEQPISDEPKWHAKQRKKDSEKPLGRPDTNGDDVQDAGDKRHSRVLSKFSKSKRVTAAAASSGTSETKLASSSDNKAAEEHEPELHGLVPLPQPAQVEDEDALPAYSTLPAWMARPLRVSSDQSSTFASMNLDDTLLSNLHGKGFEQAFPVQSAVIPLLKTGEERHDGDICISAATGSGKTLAYVVPMIEALKDLAGRKLRGLIVVPTRELVNQAREVCETCAAGTGLTIATALGNKPFGDEQLTLIESRYAYDPERYQDGQKQSMDWTRFGLEDLVLDSGDVSRRRAAFNYVEEYDSLVDILICTPGRLVDHLRATTGFNLDHVQWLIVDEADRLLNESFQEWVEVVMPALRSGEATKRRDSILRAMRMEIPERIIRKVICSATLTQDVSKLNSLEFRNPKLVVVGNTATVNATAEGEPAVDDEEPTPDVHGTFNLPMTLSEASISVGDGSEKPLYLLELLRSHVATHRNQLGISNSSNIPTAPPENGVIADSKESSSETSTSSSDTESDTSMDDSDSARGTPTGTFEVPKNGFQASLEAYPSMLIFTRSTESATRLSRLLSLLAPDLSSRIGTLTKSSTSSATSRKTLSQLQSGKLRILIATDRASRGLDVPNLQHVVSYDVPTSLTTYVHRVGRTARAGKSGHAWTLVAHREGRWFSKEIGGNGDGADEGTIARSGKIRRVNIELEDEGMRERYEDALKQLGEEVRGGD